MAQRQFRSDDTSIWNHKFGYASDGTYSSGGSGAWTQIRNSCSGTSGSTSLSVSAGSGTLSNNDLVAIFQMRGTGVGNWELNRISSGGGTSTLTMESSLVNTYTDSGDSQAQIAKIYEYSNFTVNSGHTISLPAWDGNDGGIMCVAVNGTATITGNISGDGLGFKGGIPGRDVGSNANAYEGEGTGGASAQSTTANGNGGGGATERATNEQGNGGGGGGNGTAGTIGSYADTPPNGGTRGAAGATAGNAGLTSMVMGGAGGGGGFGDNDPGGGYGNGGDGGGIILLLAKTITITGSITNDGAAGENGSSDQGAGGGGAGGSVLLKTITATLGTSKIGATAGAGGTGVGDGGAGGVGRIHLDYLASYTGTTSPTLDARQDFSLRLGQSSGVII